MSMRYTIVEESRAISFNGPGHLLKMVAASVSNGETTITSLMDRLYEFDEFVTTQLRNGLAVFDEYCLLDDPDTIIAWAERDGKLRTEPFRVLDSSTRAASLHPGRLGLVIVNLNERRIVQVQNSYGTLLRCDRGRLRQNGRPTHRFYRYELPGEWTIVP